MRPKKEIWIKPNDEWNRWFRRRHQSSRTKSLTRYEWLRLRWNTSHLSSFILRSRLHFSIAHHPNWQRTPNKGFFRQCYFSLLLLFCICFRLLFHFHAVLWLTATGLTGFFFFYSSFVLALIVFLFLFLFSSVFAIVNSQHIFHCVCLYMCVKYFNIKFVSHSECILTVQFNTSK